MRNKGAIATLSMLILSSILSVTIAGVGIDRINTLEQTIRAETIDIPANRIQNNLIMVSSLKEGSIEMEFTSEYNITREDDKTYIAYERDKLELSKGKKTFKSRINETEKFSAETGKDDKVCIMKQKNSIPKITPGECEEWNLIQ
ncbi:hypothetical protein [Candidatus Nanohalobium constans]|uniref:Uncharacterized protein n=1 Tax=Candidatus Nanohalobium constans TaxID=2565781 RepID=A0A5Q0UJ25_9ARCH|nr:hypothetical protein [Candidatus Nanohalobium constans]QGA80829.1 hypothetical protein LC1Nh_0947 [Candidatus Nanohalobium constans]